MKNRMMVMLIALGSVLLSAALAGAEEVVYVQSVKAKIMSGPAFSAKAIGEASRGTRIRSLGAEGSWIKVDFHGQEGFVSKLLVSFRPPMEKKRLITAEGTELSQGVRRRASTFTSAAAARGLAADDRRRISREQESNWPAVDKMETFGVSNDEILDFQKGAL